MEREVLYGTETSPTGLVKADAYIDDITSFLPGFRRNSVAEKVAQLLAQQQNAHEADFCITSNEVGVKLEGEGMLEVAAECYAWAFQQSDSLANFGQSFVGVYAGNFIRVLSRIANQPHLEDESRSYLKSKGKDLLATQSYLNLLKNQLIYQRAYRQLGPEKMVWNGDEEEKYILDIQETANLANPLINLT